MHFLWCERFFAQRIRRSDEQLRRRHVENASKELDDAKAWITQAAFQLPNVAVGKPNLMGQILNCQPSAVPHSTYVPAKDLRQLHRNRRREIDNLNQSL